jgi:hypothetical protein
MADEQKRRVGTCCCGNLKAETVGEPFVVSVCSCIDCQRWTGSAFNTVTYWDESKVSLSGDAQCFVRERPDGRNSHIYFCPKCGVTVYWYTPRRVGQIGVAYGAFADQSLPGPVASVWEKRKHSWISIPVERHYEENGPAPVLSS